ncbi:MAG TPA: YciI family protein [Terriglobia bacterium]|nr:YciI family protein [Terriglobia bacterium]
MKYMLLVYMEEDAMSDRERQDCYVESAGLTREIHANGKYLGAAPLHPVATATSLRIREGRRLITDGPFAETREQLGGFFMVDAENLDDALEIASRIPGARKGTIEVRPVLEIAGLPSSQ